MRLLSTYSAVGGNASLATQWSFVWINFESSTTNEDRLTTVWSILKSGRLTHSVTNAFVGLALLLWSSQRCQMYNNYRICMIILPSVRCTINNVKKGQMHDFAISLSSVPYGKTDRYGAFALKANNGRSDRVIWCNWLLQQQQLLSRSKNRASVLLH